MRTPTFLPKPRGPTTAVPEAETASSSAQASQPASNPGIPLFLRRPQTDAATPWSIQRHADSLTEPQHYAPPLSRQPALPISQPGDACEEEADRIADQVLRMPDSALPESPIALGRRRCTSGNDERGRVLRKAVQPSAFSLQPSDAPPFVHEVLSSPGQPLDAQTRVFFEPRFGCDLSDVRVHTDAKAAASARAVAADAYTVGAHIAFAAGHYQPATGHGIALLAHELGHAIQHAASPVCESHRLAPHIVTRQRAQSPPRASTSLRLTYTGELPPYTVSEASHYRQLVEANTTGATLIVTRLVQHYRHVYRVRTRDGRRWLEDNVRNLPPRIDLRANQYWVMRITNPDATPEEGYEGNVWLVTIVPNQSKSAAPVEVPQSPSSLTPTAPAPQKADVSGVSIPPTAEAAPTLTMPPEPPTIGPRPPLDEPGLSTVVPEGIKSSLDIVELFSPVEAVTAPFGLIAIAACTYDMVKLVAAAGQINKKIVVAMGIAYGFVAHALGERAPDPTVPEGWLLTPEEIENMFTPWWQEGTTQGYSALFSALMNLRLSKWRVGFWPPWTYSERQHEAWGAAFDEYWALWELHDAIASNPGQAEDVLNSYFRALLKPWLESEPDWSRSRVDYLHLAYPPLGRRALGTGSSE